MPTLNSLVGATITLVGTALVLVWGGPGVAAGR